MTSTSQVQQAVNTTLEAVEEAKKSTGQIGIKQIGNLTPNWAQWMFRIWFYMAQFATIIIAMIAGVPDKTKVQILLYMAIANIAVHGFSKIWGIDTKKIQQEAVDAFNQAQQP